MLDRCLEDLERRIDGDVEDRLHAEWVGFSEGRSDGGLFTPQRGCEAPPGVEWPEVRVNAALADFDQMALQQFRGCSETLAAGNGAMMCVRSNYGVSILPSLFGVELFMMDDETNTLPTSYPLGSIDRIEAVVDAGVPDPAGSLGGRTLAMGEHYAAIRDTYPKIAKHVHVYHPDIQGPMDVCEVLWGSEIFVALVDRPDLVHALLDLVTETYIRFLRRWEAIIPFEPTYQAHWGLFHKGTIMLRDDSAMNLSPEMFDEFIAPYDQRLLDEFGGGAIHFCGRGDHYIARMCRLRGLHAINLSQPDWNNMAVIYQSTVDRGIKLIGLRREAAEAALAAGRDLHGCVHCG